MALESLKFATSGGFLSHEGYPAFLIQFQTGCSIKRKFISQGLRNKNC